MFRQPSAACAKESTFSKTPGVMSLMILGLSGCLMGPKHIALNYSLCTDNTVELALNSRCSPPSTPTTKEMSSNSG